MSSTFTDRREDDSVRAFAAGGEDNKDDSTRAKGPSASRRVIVGESADDRKELLVRCGAENCVRNINFSSLGYGFAIYSFFSHDLPRPT
jgi:hypothetical protein